MNFMPGVGRFTTARLQASFAGSGMGSARLKKPIIAARATSEDGVRCSQHRDGSRLNGDCELVCELA